MPIRAVARSENPGGSGGGTYSWVGIMVVRFSFITVKLTFCEKGTIFLQNHQLRFVLCNNGQMYGGNFTNLVAFSEYMNFHERNCFANINISMTSLFAHKVAQPTKWRFLPKNLSQLVIFVIGLAFTWV